MPVLLDIILCQPHAAEVYIFRGRGIFSLRFKFDMLEIVMWHLAVVKKINASLLKSLPTSFKLIPGLLCEVGVWYALAVADYQ